MLFLRRFLGNHVLANLAFMLVLVLGGLSYMDMPRARDPDINFNWINIFTVLPGASALEVEKRITDPIEDTISRTTKDLRFVSSTSRDGASSILVRFNELSEREFDKRVADLRREVQNAYNDQLPPEAQDPVVREITTSSGFPTAVVALTSLSNDEAFRRYATSLKNSFERISGVDEAALDGIEDPELHIAFYPERLVGLGITPAALVDTVRSYFRDISIGDIETDSGKWIVRLEGTSGSIEALASFPVIGARGSVPLGSLADIYRTRAEPSVSVRYQGDAAAMFSLTKQEDVNILGLLDELITFIDTENALIADRGYRLILIDDQTISTREAIGVTQTNALIGLVFVVLVTFMFLGGHISLLTSIGIPFTLAGTFLVLNMLGLAVSNPVLIGVVIALGMLVDDAVVVVEAIYYRLQRGANAMDAAIDALREVASPVLTSVLTTIAVFLPLMLLPGIMGEFLRVIPLVVCIGLIISLAEAFWMLPAHIAMLKVDLQQESRWQRLRRIFTRKVRHGYSLWLIAAMRRPRVSLVAVLLLMLSATGLLVMGKIKMDFFAADPLRIFYVNAELPRGATLTQSTKLIEQLEAKTLQALEPGELRASIVYAGQSFTATAPIFGDTLSQVFLSINPDDGDMRSMEDIIGAVETTVGTSLGEAQVSVVKLEDGPPIGQPISLKIRGDEFDRIQAVADQFVAMMNEQAAFKNINVDFKTGNPEMVLALDGDAINRAGLSPVTVSRSLQSYVDGELVNQYQDLGEEIDVRVLAKTNDNDVDALLQQTIASGNGEAIAIGELVDVHYGAGYQGIRHYDFKRTITVAADFDDALTDTVAANQLLADYWDSIHEQHPTINIDFSGELDDLNESLDGLKLLFVMGIGLIYLILGTQFKSYGQPLLVLMSVPLAFCGVVFGLLLTNNPLSLMTLYGVVALAGISVNSAIVLTSAANARLEAGMSVLHAIIFAARRRVIPILITSFTTIAGLFSMAAGLAGDSLTWGPVATAIISGLMFSTVLVLIVIPLLYLAVMSASTRRRKIAPHAS